MASGTAGTRAVLGGFAVVCCVHDREKREVTDPEQVRYLGRVLGVEFDPRRHVLQKCACCENLHVTLDDTPRLCATCSQTPTFAIHAPVPSPLEERF